MPLIKATEKIVNLANGSIGLEKLNQTPSDLFMISLCHESTSPTASGTYRFGQFPTLIAGTLSSNLTRQVVVPYAGNLVAASISFSRLDTAGGSAGTSQMIINNLTSSLSTTLSSSLDYANNASFNAVYTSFSQFSVAANDVISGNWVVPAYTTFPQSVRHVVNLWFKRILA
ncbi:MAG: hypothetical protein EBV19_05725 [Flavobacteriia bacterium]|nr:hypothetical protein [Flavobacteriia bacterium]